MKVCRGENKTWEPQTADWIESGVCCFLTCFHSASLISGRYESECRPRSREPQSGIRGAHGYGYEI